MEGYIEGPRRGGRPVEEWKDILRLLGGGRPVVGWKDILMVLEGEEGQL